MQPLEERATNLLNDIKSATKKVGLDELLKEQNQLQALTEAQDFWGDPTKAQDVMQSLNKLRRRTDPWKGLQDEVNETLQMIQLDDLQLEPDLTKQLDKLENRFADLKSDLKFTQTFDDHDAILSIHAGAGGTDAQDWTQILLRMYVRWADQNGYKVETITDSAGDEAGLKSATIEISGDFIYGKLKGEHGVHRLVRLSPFNANHLRETSFAKVEVMPKIDKPGELVIDEKDLNIDVFRSGGHGGQSVNTTDSAVRVTHIPTGISVVIQNERSQLQNKETALTVLRSQLARLELEQHKKDLSDIKGPNQSAEWGNQIRSYVIHPYKQVKDLRTHYETSDIDSTLDGKLDPFIDSYLEHHLSV